MEEPLKEGYLHKAHPRESFLSMTVWQKRYFVLWSKGTLEYYTGYQKKGEEYRGTLNLEHCQDMVAPMAVGKRHHVIKLTVLKEGKEKEYWLDCDCPPVLNEWVKSLAEVSGLSPDENNKVKKPFPSTNQSRPLPSAPPPGGRGGVPVPYSACGTSIDHESDDEVMEGDTYEVIEDQDPVSSTENSSDSFLRFTRPLDPKGLMKDTKAACSPIVIPSMLKRGAIKEATAYSPPLSPGSRKPIPPPPLKPGPVGKRTEGFDVGELQKTLVRRTSSKSPEGVGGDEDKGWNGPTEEYEEVQFSTDVVVGTPRSHRGGTFDSNQDEIPGEPVFSFPNEDFTASYSPRVPPSIPPRDSKASTGSFTFSMQQPKQYEATTPELPHLPLGRSKKATVSNPLLVGSSSNSHQPPLPPPREWSNRPTSIGEEDSSPPPPPIPRRVPGQSDRSSVHIVSSSRSDSVLTSPTKKDSSIHFPVHANTTGTKRVLPYRTTEIINPSPSSSSSSLSSSKADSDNSGDAIVTRHNYREQLPLPSEPPQRAPSPKALPPVKPKPKPTVPVKPTKPHPHHENNHGNDRGFVDYGGGASPSNRPPAILPKPKPTTKPKPSGGGVVGGVRNNFGVEPPVISTVASPFAKTLESKLGGNLGGGAMGGARDSKKRPPMPPPKPRT